MSRMPRLYKFCAVFTIGIAVLLSGCSYQPKAAAKSTPEPVKDTVILHTQGRPKHHFRTSM